jgi:hypothetical protein
MRRVFALVALISFFTAAYSQEITVKSAPDTTAILIGDQIGFSVSVTLPPGIDATLSTAADTLAGKIIILGRSARDTVKWTDGNMTVTDRYLITSYDSGTYSIPPFYAELLSGDSLKRYYSDYSMLRVARPEVAPKDSTDVIYDIVPPRVAPLTFREILPWLVIALIAAAVVYLLARFLPRNPLKRFIRPPAPREPAHIIALRELNRLREEEIWQKGEVKEFYSRLSDILRRYIDNRYGIMSPEMTTDETVRMLQKAAVTTHDEMSLVKELLSLSDMVKFAKYVPQSQVHQKSIDDAVRFVELTREPELTAAENSKGKGGNNA